MPRGTGCAERINFRDTLLAVVFQTQTAMGNDLGDTFCAVEEGFQFTFRFMSDIGSAVEGGTESTDGLDVGDTDAVTESVAELTASFLLVNTLTTDLFVGLGTARVDHGDTIGAVEIKSLVTVGGGR